MRSKQNWPALILEWQESGQTRAAFCKDRGISYQSFLWNLKRMSRPEEGEFRQIMVHDMAAGERIDYHFSDGRCVSFPVSAPRELIRFIIGL
ncbi:MAG: IS66 family insertion sequence element accessory protein TnpA [Flavobacteriales bacterium]